MTELKPCPLCAGRAREWVENSGLQIGCSNCGLRLFRAFVPAASWEDVAPRAREAWNKRTTDVPSEPAGKKVDAIACCISEMRPRDEDLSARASAQLHAILAVTRPGPSEAVATKTELEQAESALRFLSNEANRRADIGMNCGRRILERALALYRHPPEPPE